MLASRGFVVFLTLAFAVSAQAEADNGPRDVVRAQAEAALRDRDCQTTLPSLDGAGGSGPGSADDESGGGGRRGSGRRVSSDAAPSSGGSLFGSGLSFSLAVPVLWVLVTIAAAILLAAILRSFSSGRAPSPARAEKKRLAAASREPDAPAAAEQLPDHARLVAAGDVAAAVRVLLWHAFDHLAKRAGALPAQATGRELLERSREDGIANEDLTALVRTVELLHFGGRPGETRHYDESLRHYENWRLACADAK